jgi:hypothetical protein
MRLLRQPFVGYITASRDWKAIVSFSRNDYKVGDIVSLHLCPKHPIIEPEALGFRQLHLKIDSTFSRRHQLRT